MGDSFPPCRLRLTQWAKRSGEHLIEDRASGELAVLIGPVAKAGLVFKKYISRLDCKLVSMACMTFGVYCSVAVGSMVGTVARVARDTAVTTTWVVD